MSGNSTLITANAGCGKTWTLTNRCIGWMVAQRRATGDAQPSGLVAATFTRKAAGEILHRLLTHLSQASLDPKSIKLFKEGFGLDEVPTQEELLGVLQDVVAGLHRLQFGTLDGFYHRIAATFAGEINMPSGWTIGDAPTLAAIQDLPGEVTLAFSPYSSRLAEWVPAARAAGHEVLLQLPMEPRSTEFNDPGNKALLTANTPELNLDRMEWVLSRAEG